MESGALASQRAPASAPFDPSSRPRLAATLQGYKDDEMNRPVVERFDDELDQWGRPRAPIVRMPTEALPENIDTSSVDTSKIESLEDAIGALRTIAGRNKDGSIKGSGQGSTEK